MVILVAGGTHTGKTLFAQQLLERYHFPTLSLDHLKMGLIRSGHCPLTPQSDDAEMTGYLWPIAREMVKTAIENKQNLIVEGCYIPFGYASSFPPEYQKDIRYVCLILSEEYINTHYDTIWYHASCIEQRLDDSDLSKDLLLEENRHNLAECRRHGLDHVLVEDRYEIDWEP